MANLRYINIVKTLYIKLILHYNKYYNKIDTEKLYIRGIYHKKSKLWLQKQLQVKILFNCAKDPKCVESFRLAWKLLRISKSFSLCTWIWNICYPKLFSGPISSNSLVLDVKYFFPFIKSLKYHLKLTNIA